MDLLYMLRPFSNRVAERMRLAERMSAGRWNLHQKMIALYGENTGLRHSKRFAADVVSACLLAAAALTLLFAATGGDLYTIVCGIGAAVLVPFFKIRRLERQIAGKKRAIAMELPELLNKLTLLVNAGETVQGAILRCAAGYRTSGADTPLSAELIALANRLHHNEPFPAAIEQFSRRCGVQEVSAFATALLMNYRRGGEQLVMALRSLGRDMWEKRKAMARTLGEEASSKLIIPMLLIFIAVMAIVAAPAVMLMDG